MQTPTCQIQWISRETGRPTPDNHKAIGTVYREAYDYQHPLDDKPHHFQQTDKFYICAQHAKQLAKADMCHWIFEEFIDKDQWAGEPDGEGIRDGDRCQQKTILDIQQQACHTMVHMKTSMKKPLTKEQMEQWKRTIKEFKFETVDGKSVTVKANLFSEALAKVGNGACFMSWRDEQGTEKKAFEIPTSI